MHCTRVSYHTSIQPGSPNQCFLESIVLLLQLLVLSIGSCSLHTCLTDLLLDDLEVYRELLDLLLQCLVLQLQTLRLEERKMVHNITLDGGRTEGEEVGGRDGERNQEGRLGRG